MKNTSAFDAVDGCAYRYASAVEEEVPPWSARGAKNKENKRGNAAQTTAFRYLCKAKSV